MKFFFDFELYPEIPDSILLDAANTIQKNIKNWGHPFFMDVYSHADLNELKEACKPFLENKNLEHLIVLGTGGSIQTMLALDGILKLKFHPIYSSRPKELVEVLNNCPPEKSVVVPISRAGETLDINSTLELFKDYPMIGLSSKGPMYEYLRTKNIPILPVPDLAGRFAASVCSVALVPSILGGIDVDLFLQSMAEAYSEFKDLGDLKQNYALHYATYCKIMYDKGYRNVFNMAYSSYLEGAAGLFVQEISESTGKENKGILGTAQIAPLCQHSVLELLLGGSKGHTTPLIWTTESEPDDLKINNPEFGLINQTALNVIKYQADATFQALLTQEVPTAKIQLKEISEQGYGHLIAFIQSFVYYLCMLLNVNWENNPLVNTGKKICNDAIKQNKTPEERKSLRMKVADKHFSNLKFSI